VGELHVERRQELAEIIVREMGKPIEQALGELDFVGDIYGFYADNAEALMADEPIRLLAGEGSAVVRRSSLGVLLGIMPWNVPYYQVARFAAPNLVLGNVIVLKHASQCPESAAAIEAIYRDAGLPDGAYVNVYVSAEQAAKIVADPRIQGVSVTGSERAGAAVAEVAGRHLKKVALELGGSDPFLVLATDDLDTVGVLRERPVAPGGLGRVRPPVAGGTWEHADRLLDPDLPQLVPRRRSPRLQQDLGEAQHVRSS
jgi:succinate-semialdehyde dehydrogenase/glutarate-semialdehyde dehydrogenase